MRILFSVTLAAILALSVSPSQAKDSFDVSTLTCSDMLTILEDSSESFTLIMIWMDGYLGGVTGNTEFDPDYIGRLTESFVEACSASPKKKALAVVRELAL